MAFQPGGRVPHWALQPLLLSGRKSFHGDPGLDLTRALIAVSCPNLTPAALASLTTLDTTRSVVLPTLALLLNHCRFPRRLELNLGL